VALDRAAQKGIIHPNNAARRKSRLFLRYNAAVAALQAPAEEKPARKTTKASGQPSRARKTPAKKTSKK
jgi:hypothetical protein